MEPNPCVGCGACCAFYRASFYWRESEEFTPGGVPSSLTRKMDDFRLMMLGTGGSRPRCIALEGTVGADASCGIYSRRSTVCRDFAPSWSSGRGNPRCDEARRAWGLPALSPDSWPPWEPDRPDNLPQAA